MPVSARQPARQDAVRLLPVAPYSSQADGNPRLFCDHNQNLLYLRVKFSRYFQSIVVSIGRKIGRHLSYEIRTVPSFIAIGVALRRRSDEFSICSDRAEAFDLRAEPIVDIGPVLASPV